MACRCGGDITSRHYGVRDVLSDILAEADLAPVKEKAGLLPARAEGDRPGPLGEEHLPPEPPDPGSGRRQMRRPADIWVKPWAGTSAARGKGLAGVAYDVAVTSVLCPAVLCQPVTPTAAQDHLRSYADKKRAYQDTAKQCLDASLDFVPLVFDGCSGGWDSEVQTLLSEAARIMVAKGNTLDAACGRSVHSIVAQRTSISLQKELARATIRRQAGIPPAPDNSGAGEDDGRVVHLPILT